MSVKESYITAFLLLALGFVSHPTPASARSATPNEYRVKAAFIYQFVNFIDGWKFQQEGNKDSDRPILIGIIGKNPFQDAFEPLKDKQVKNRDVTIRNFKSLSEFDSANKKTKHHPEIEDIKKCDIIFICPSEKQYIDYILEPIRHEHILTISETQGFVENGGIINFIAVKNKVRFEINTAGAHRAKLKIRSKLLRLAKRIFTSDDVDEE